MEFLKSYADIQRLFLITQNQYKKKIQYYRKENKTNVGTLPVNLQ